MSVCIVCKVRKLRVGKKYCSNKCQWEGQYQEYIAKWKKGLVGGSRGLRKKNISAHLKHFLFEKYGERCLQCGWNEKHPITGKAPLEVDHIDGNADNNSEKNLRVLCPNCHSLTSNFRNLNKGRGRSWRK